MTSGHRLNRPSLASKKWDAEQTPDNCASGDSGIDAQIAMRCPDTLPVAPRTPPSSSFCSIMLRRYGATVGADKSRSLGKDAHSKYAAWMHISVSSTLRQLRTHQRSVVAAAVCSLRFLIYVSSNWMGYYLASSTVHPSHLYLAFLPCPASIPTTRSPPNFCPVQSAFNRLANRQHATLCWSRTRRSKRETPEW